MKLVFILLTTLLVTVGGTVLVLIVLGFVDLMSGLVDDNVKTETIDEKWDKRYRKLKYILSKRKNKKRKELEDVKKERDMLMQTLEKYGIKIEK